MRRVAITFALFASAYPLLAFVMRGAFGPAGALTLAGVTTAATVVLGVPAFILMCRRGWLEWWQLLCGGAAIGFVCALPFAIAGSALVLALIPTFLVLGAAHGVLFWGLAIWRNAGLVARCGHGGR
jgi:ABC-type tungstate transport system substrate-binding protein